MNRIPISAGLQAFGHDPCSWVSFRFLPVGRLTFDKMASHDVDYDDRMDVDDHDDDFMELDPNEDEPVCTHGMI